MAKILLLTLIFSPDGVSTAQLFTELALELKSRGHEVVVVTTTPHYNLDSEARASQPLQPFWGKILMQSNCQGIPVYHVSVPPKGSRVESRMFDYLRFHLISTLAAIWAAGPYDVILTPSPPLTIGVSAWIIGLLRRVPFIYNVQEIYPDVAVRLGVLRNPRIIQLMEQIERFIYARSAVITTISEWFKQRLVEKGVPSEKVELIPNFVDATFIQPGDRSNEFSTNHGLDHSFVVLYAGNIGLTQGFETILAAARQLEHLEGLRFLIVGDGSRRAWLEEQLKLAPCANVTMLPYQPRSVVPMIYASSDLCLVPLKGGTAQETFPSKIYTIMAAERAVLASADVDSELSWVVGRAHCGWSIPPDDPTAMAKVIKQAYQDRAALQIMGSNGRSYVLERHSLQVVADQYDTLIQRVIKK